MRIATLLPSATEIVCALGLAGDIVGITHECDFPPEIRGRSLIVRGTIDSVRLTSAEINAQVETSLTRGEPLYGIDIDVLRAARPDLLITQDLCEVCALPGTDVDAALTSLPIPPRVLRLHPHTLSDILRDVRLVGAATGREAEAQQLVARLEARIARIEAAVRAQPRPRVCCLEWVDPAFCGGHWMPEMVERAGGREVVGVAGRPSFQVEWSQIAAAQPDVVVLVLCGFDVARTQREARVLATRAEWRSLPAVRAGRVYATDASSYFSRSGPRIVDGLEILASLLHPGAAAWSTPPGSWAVLDSVGAPAAYEREENSTVPW
jgi:iron complex transport system substrate-binding protein